MKVKTLIEELQKYDSELEVCVGNIDIHFISQQPSYYDGYLQVLERDESLSPYYDIVGAKFEQECDKVKIHTLSIRDVIWNDPDAPIESFNEEQKEMIAKWRQEAKDFEKELDEEE